ncbi:HtaA domain-containing protein [Nocardioides humi]|uniref:Htaa domain-containing protein n=1 Tax=Nocardioides humi TaxID=449461 RepID=A0ABN2AHM0_9ACTN|nr:HtaA domain-containing protein [Nocardioides humi]
MTESLPEGLMWGLKATFLAYLAGLPDARFSATGGAVVDERQRILFPTESTEEFDPARGEGTIRFAGDVRFAGHHGMMFVMVAQPWLTFRAGAATLSIVDPASHPAMDRRLDLLDVEERGWGEHRGARLYAPMPATLRAAGVELFNHAYPAGEPFDPLSVRVVV